MLFTKISQAWHAVEDFERWLAVLLSELLGDHDYDLMLTRDVSASAMYYRAIKNGIDHWFPCRYG